MSRAAGRSLLSRLLRRVAATVSPGAASSEAAQPSAKAPGAPLAGFDPEWYLFRYPEVIGYQPDPVSHFRRHGFAEGRDPSPYVSLNRVFAADPDARAASVDAVMGRIAALAPDAAEALLPDDAISFAYLLRHYGLFDEAWYAARYPDLKKAAMPLLSHFVAHGATEGRDSGPDFDAELYRATYPQYIERSSSAIEDYVRFGFRRGYAARGPGRYERWVAHFDTLTADHIRRLDAAVAVRGGRAVAVHVIDAAACRHAARIIAGWRDRVDRCCPVRFLRGVDVTDADWRDFSAKLNGAPGLDIATAAGSATDAIPAGAVVLCSGPLLVRPHATLVLGAVLREQAAEACYGDHDGLDAKGGRHSPRFKPAMSPALMETRPYAGALVCAALEDGTQARIEEALAAAVAGEAEAGFARLLLGSVRERVAHAPFVLFHDLEAERDAGVLPVEPSPTINAETPRVPVSIVIPTRDHAALLRACVDSLACDTDYPASLVEIVILDNDSREPDAVALLAELSGRDRIRVIPAPGAFNFSRLCNAGAAGAQGEVLVFLNNDMTVHRRDWLLQLVAQATQPDVGIVGAQLLYPDGSVQHAGVVLGIQGVAAHRLSDGGVGPAGAIGVTRETVAVTGACLAIRRPVFERLGGFDPVLRVAFNDVGLCIAAHEAGLRNICVGAALFLHHESKSRGADNTSHKRRRNARESIYVRERHGALFRDDPFYSPNLSLQAVDGLAMPPRVPQPWRRVPGGPRRALLVSFHHSIGSGVAVVLQQQAAFMRGRGWEVIVGGPVRPGEIDYQDCRRVDLWTAEAASIFAVTEALDAVIAHTDPFFSMVRFLGEVPLLYFTDHGEPPPHFFADWREREALDWEKRSCAPMARRVFAISDTIKAGQFRSDAVVIRNGNSHLASWSPAWEERRRVVRARLGLSDRFVVLNVCRFGAADRLYKGVNRYAAVAADLPYLYPDLADEAHFILAGRGKEADIAEMRALGIDVHANVSDAELIDLYAAADLYMNFSQWEGYNLGVGQALAMGLDVIASDIAAHREFGIETSDSDAGVCAALAARVATRNERSARRAAMVEPWAVPLALMCDLIEADLREVGARQDWLTPSRS